MIDYGALYRRMRSGPMADWHRHLPTEISNRFTIAYNANIPDWLGLLQQLPDIEPSSINLDTSCPRIGMAGDINETERNRLTEQLKRLHPWRKGPFELFGIHIDTEWRSDWKWDRLSSHIQSLSGRKVMDVGCGNGYYGWRMAAAGADMVIGIDPTMISVMQYHAMQHFIKSDNVFVLPLGVDDVPEGLATFDTVFSMGVLYHRRQAVDHIKQLSGMLRPGGELVIETLVVDGDASTELNPDGRYAKMRNVWTIPSCLKLEQWMKQCGLTNVCTVDVTKTTTDEQRSTDWMTFHSLKDFLHPDHADKTVEGYPAPQRAILIANKT